MPESPQQETVKRPGSFCKSFNKNLFSEFDGVEGKSSSETAGNLEKKGGLLKSSWQTRYFVLSGNKLSYCERKGSVEKGSLILKGCIVSLSEDAEYNVVMCFRGRHLKHDYTLRCPADEREKWLTAIRLAGAIVAGDATVPQMLQAALQEHRVTQNRGTINNGPPQGRFIRWLHSPSVTPMKVKIDKFLNQLIPQVQDELAKGELTEVHHNDICESIHTFIIDFATRMKRYPEALTEIAEDEIYDMVENYVMSVLNSYLWNDEILDRDLCLQWKLRALSSVLTPDQLGAPAALSGQSHIEMAATELRLLPSALTPYSKARRALLACARVVDALGVTVEGSFAADEYLPSLIWAILVAAPPRLIQSIEYVALYRNPSVTGTSSTGYFLQSLRGAIHFLESGDRSSFELNDDQIEVLKNSWGLIDTERLLFQREEDITTDSTSHLKALKCLADTTKCVADCLTSLNTISSEENIPHIGLAALLNEYSSSLRDSFSASKIVKFQGRSLDIVLSKFDTNLRGILSEYDGKGANGEGWDTL